MKANQICRALTHLLMLVICFVLAPCAWAEEAAPGEIAENQPVLTSSPISFTIPDHVTNIESEAFYNCTGMTSVYIPASVTSIGNGAFHGCINLTDVYLGGAWTDISVGSDNAPLLNATIHAGTSGSWGNLQWQLDGPSGKLTIYGSGAMDNFLSDTDYDGALPAWRSYKEDIKAVEILNGVTSIGNYAFYGCNNLSSITIPTSVTSIGDGAFWMCRSLSGITIPTSVTSIGNYAFYGCNNLSSITIPSGVTSIGNGAFWGCSSLSSITIPSGVTSIGEHTFIHCSDLSNITIPTSVTSIGYAAFYGCAALSDVYYSGTEAQWRNISISGYSSDGQNAPLYNATIHAGTSGSWGNLQWQLDGPSGKLTIYGSGAMDNFLYDTDYDGTLPAWRSYKEDIKAVEILNGVTSIGECAFTGCKSLSSITIPSSVTSIGGASLAQCESLSVVIIPSGVTTIGNGAFFLCENLNCVSIPSSMQTIGDSAFVSFSGSLSDVYYGGTEEQWQNISIAGYSVNGTNADLYAAEKHFYSSRREGSLGNLHWSLDEAGTLVISGSGPMDNYLDYLDSAWGPYRTDIKTVKICEGVTNIASWAFLNCTSLSSVTIPSSVTSIERGAFEDCENLSSVTIPSRVTSIGQQAFEDCENLSSVTIAPGVTSIESMAFHGCTSLSSITIPSSVTSIEGWAFRDCTSLRSVTIQPGVTSIEDRAFAGCTSLRSVTIPSSVTHIGNEAFRDCTNLRSVTIPESVTIDYACFWNCTSLSSVTIPSGVTLNQSVFHGCTSLRSVTIPSSVTHIYADLFYGCTSLSSVTIPSGVTSIGSDAFYNCTGLKSITIPASVTSIGIKAFYGCNLSDVYYSGTEAQWKANDNLRYNSAFQNATIHYNSAQVPVPVVTSTVCDPDDGIVTVSYNEKIPNEFTITVTAQGDGLSYSWLWREEGETQSQWKDISQISLMMVIGSQTSNAIKIRTEDMNLNGHNYEFMCVVFNGYAHAVSSIVTIHVVDPQNPDPVTKPAISLNPRSVTATATGSSASFSVTATGSGLHYQWQVRRSSSGSWEKATDTGSGTATLTVSVTGEKNGYEYRCKVFNSEGTAYSRAATLNVAWPIITSITCDGNPITGSLHHSTDTTNMCHITVTASGDDLSYSWKWRKHGTGTWQDRNTAPMSVLEITPNRIELQCYDSALNGNSYDFMCTVSNQYGVASDTITIDVVSID